jgi:hypothetical protein
MDQTLALSIMVVIGSNIFGAFVLGAWKTFNKYVNLKDIVTTNFDKLTNKQLTDFIHLIQYNYLREKDNIFYNFKIVIFNIII